MKKVIVFVAVSAFLGFMSLGSVAVADDVIPGSYGQHDGSVMGVGKTMMQIGSHNRSLTNAVNLASGAGRSRSNNGGGASGGLYQFGSSQSEQSWKAAKTVEEAQVRGLVPGDCQGDNSDEVYRKQMNQNRNGYMKENLVSNSQCGDYHPTLK
ncbi:MAG: hypothetical protein HOL15_01330 [Nitrospinaceae bacterium]|nr:hypothetical protein [Nitrospinaceae bacterium]MBT5867915.1 hypothetical protein [Nitrospinaceae bacterium]MBT6346464.1 hypothetical protein [Nitrospina sp.]